MKKLIGKKFDSVIETSAGKKVSVATPQFYDILAYCKRGPAVILPKDFAAIVSLTGVGKNSEVADIGTGSGWLAAQLANICKKVTTYEIRKDFYQLANRNFEFLGLKTFPQKMLMHLRALQKKMWIWLLLMLLSHAILLAWPKKACVLADILLPGTRNSQTGALSASVSSAACGSRKSWLAQN